MNIISWNVRGLNGRTKKRVLRNNIMAENPDILLLQETKCVDAIAENTFLRCWT
jgi:exonuclease III